MPSGLVVSIFALHFGIQDFMVSLIVKLNHMNIMSSEDANGIAILYFTERILYLIWDLIGLKYL